MRLLLLLSIFFVGCSDYEYTAYLDNSTLQVESCSMGGNVLYYRTNEGSAAMSCDGKKRCLCIRSRKNRGE